MGIKIKFRRIHHYLVLTLIAVLCIAGYIAWMERQPEPPRILTEQEIATQAIIDEWYTPLHPMMIDTVAVEASIANTTATRTKGLSDTPHLPALVVKLFVFDTSEEWSFWMKDMNYPIDIIWVDATGSIVFIEEEVSPASYPMSFLPNKPAKYVVETAAGFVAEHGIIVGDTVVLPKDV